MHTHKLSIRPQAQHGTLPPGTKPRPGRTSPCAAMREKRNAAPGGGLYKEAL